MNIDNINMERVFYNTLYIGWSFVVGFLFALYLIDAEKYNTERQTINKIENRVLNWESQTLSKDEVNLIIRGY